MQILVIARLRGKKHGMDFEKEQAIYLQIGDHICENILTGVLSEGERIPSTRDMAVSMEVNPNTVVRTYADLQGKGILRNRRGIGYFVADDAQKRILRIKREEFLHKTLPDIFKTMDLLGISFEELRVKYGRQGK